MLGAMAPELDPARLGDHIDRLYRAAWALTGKREDADDLVQETFARVLSRPRWLRQEDDLGYLLAALRKTFFNQRRTASRRPQTTMLPEDDGAVEPRSSAQPEAALEAAEVYRAVAALPDDYRDVIAAVDVAGLSYEETAKALSIPIGTVMSRLYRARRQIVRQLEAEPG
jgi:RNA polymerase sigma-70 factor (ECF subfamily)